MAWVTLRILDNHQVAGATADRRRRLWQRGDIVDVTDVHPGPGVTASPRLLAINFPGVAASQLQDFVEGHELGRRLRKWRVDDALAAMPQAARTKIVDAVRDRTDIELTAGQLAWIRDYLEARA